MTLWEDAGDSNDSDKITPTGVRLVATYRIANLLSFLVTHVPAVSDWFGSPTTTCRDTPTNRIGRLLAISNTPITQKQSTCLALLTGLPALIGQASDQQPVGARHLAVIRAISSATIDALITLTYGLCSDVLAPSTHWMVPGDSKTVGRGAQILKRLAVVAGAEDVDRYGYICASLDRQVDGVCLVLSGQLVASDAVQSIGAGSGDMDKRLVQLIKTIMAIQSWLSDWL